MLEKRHKFPSKLHITSISLTQKRELFIDMTISPIGAKSSRSRLNRKQLHWREIRKKLFGDQGETRIA